MTANMDMEFIHGLMEDNMQGVGKMESSMELGHIDKQTGKRRKGCGKMVNAFAGSIEIRYSL